MVALAMSAALYAQEPPKSVKDAIKRADAAVAKIIAIPAKQRTFANTLGALDDISVRLDNETSMTLFMQYVSTDAKEREASRAAEEAVVNWTIDLGKNEALYKAVKAYADTKPKLTGEKARFLEHTMRDYRLSGMTLPKAQRDKLAALEKEMSKLGTDFDTAINEDQTKVALTEAELAGVPPQALSGKPKVGNVYLLGLDGPTYGAVMDYCTVAETRQKMQWLYRRRAGEKNVERLNNLLNLRWQAAQMLGYKNTVDMVLATRMAKNSDTVAKFYNDLRPIVRRKAEQDFAALTQAKRDDTSDANAKLNPWDFSYYRNRLLASKYAVDTQKVSEYFSMENVLKGLFDISQNLFGVQMKDVTKDAGKLGFKLWHPDVKLYEFYDKASGKLMGRLFTDLYPREYKYNHAACWGLRPRKVWADGTVQVPLAALVCNFPKPTADRPALLKHDDVETFFHEFGHGLHQIFTETSMGRFSGTAVARDFVEAPSQMMENWVWDPGVLKTFAKHYQTGETIPDALVQSMQAARNVTSGLDTEGQFWLGLMDQKFHTAKNGEIDTIKANNEIYDSVTMWDPVPGTFSHASFGHLNGYEGAYYGYMWSLVYAQDMFNRFEELGIMNPEAGMYYRKKVLARGGSMDEMAMLRDYLGREPNMNSFLKHLGLQP
jgi:thimet oligopeptidase